MHNSDIMLALHPSWEDSISFSILRKLKNVPQWSRTFIWETIRLCLTLWKKWGSWINGNLDSIKNLIFATFLSCIKLNFNDVLLHKFKLVTIATLITIVMPFDKYKVYWVFFFSFINFDIMAFKWHPICHDWTNLKFWPIGLPFYGIALGKLEHIKFWAIFIHSKT